MLHMILVILKIIGILIAVLLALLLLAVLLVLFVPIRYRVDAKATDHIQDASVRLRIRWFMGLLEMQGGYQDGNFNAWVRLLWIRKWLAGQEIPSEYPKTENALEYKEEAAAEKKEQKKKEQKKKEEHSSEEGRENQEEQKTWKEQQNQEGQNIGREQQNQEGQNIGREQQNQSPGMVGEEQKKLRFPDFQGFFKKIADIRKRFLKKISDLKASIRSVWQDSRRILDFIRSEMTKEVYHILKGHFFYLLHHIRPRKLEGNLHYGLEDPSLTGQLTGILYLFLPFSCRRIQLLPDFEKKVLEGQILAAGHIRLVHLAKSGLQIILNKKIRKCWKRMKQLRRK